MNEVKMYVIPKILSMVRCIIIPQSDQRIETTVSAVSNQEFFLSWNSENHGTLKKLGEDIEPVVVSKLRKFQDVRIF